MIIYSNSFLCSSVIQRANAALPMAVENDNFRDLWFVALALFNLEQSCGRVCGTARPLRQPKVCQHPLWSCQVCPQPRPLYLVCDQILYRRSRKVCTYTDAVNMEQIFLARFLRSVYSSAPFVTDVWHRARLYLYMLTRDWHTIFFL
jgi:hypothetical protein